VFSLWLTIVRAAIDMTVSGGVSFAPSSSGLIGRTFLGSSTMHSSLHQDICERQMHHRRQSVANMQCGRRGSAQTYASAGNAALLDLDPARPHDLALDDKDFKGRGVGAEDVAEGVAVQVGGQRRLWRKETGISGGQEDQGGAAAKTHGRIRK
jgi:hypothetical protein